MKENVFEFTDVLEHATSMGYVWNDMCDELRDLQPMYENKYMEWDRSDFITDEDYETDRSEIECKVMLSFFDSIDLDFVTLI